jgi:hypothetical protein
LLQKIAITDPAETLEKALERNLLNVEHDRLLPMLGLTLGEVFGYPSNSNKTRISRRWKCSRWVCPATMRQKEFSSDQEISKSV